MLICFTLLIIEGCGDRGIDTIINDNYAISWGSVLLVEEIEVVSENTQPATINVQRVSQKIV